MLDLNRAFIQSCTHLPVALFPFFPPTLTPLIVDPPVKAIPFLNPDPLLLASYVPVLLSSLAVLKPLPPY